MTDAPDDAVGETPDRPSAADSNADVDGDADGDADVDGDADDLEALRSQVEETYDFENFGPEDMQEMSPEEWDAAFDPDTWITGEALLDRVEADLKNQVANRDVFARVERFDDLLVAYSDTGYAAVYPDGSVEGRGTVLRDVKPTVALCSMESYDVPEMPEGDLLPDPRDVPEGGGALGNTVLQVVGAIHVLAGLVLLVAWGLFVAGALSPPGTGSGSNLVLILVVALGFLFVGIFMFVIVANARLSDKFRAEEFRDRLRGIGLEDGERPAFLADIEGLDADALETRDRAGDPSRDADGGPPGESRSDG